MEKLEILKCQVKPLLMNRNKAAGTNGIAISLRIKKIFKINTLEIAYDYKNPEKIF